MKTNSFILVMGLFVFFGAKAQAQDTNTDNHNITISIPEVAILDIEPAATKNIILGFTAPTEAGNPIVPAAPNSSLWINYSSIKSTDDPTRVVTVKLASVIPGIDINVSAATYAGNGDGTLGTPSAELTLNETDQTIISGIGSSYTGDGASNGHNLTYSLVSGGGTASYADLEASATAIATVTYTISDN